MHASRPYRPRGWCVADLSIEEKLELLQLLQDRDFKQRTNKLAAYAPYAKQSAFHAAGAEPIRERLFMAGNQLGKTWAGAYEVAMHVTGRYPDWWTGHRFPRATRWIVGSESNELTKKGVQRLLLGEPEKRDEWGSGTIPKDLIVSTSMRAGVPDAVASIVVRHELGDQSVIQFNSYDQGRSKWQADTVDGIWMDEEPPEDLYAEALVRIQATGGIVFVTFTPLLGMSAVVKRFLKDKPEGTSVTSMTIDDAEHYTKAQRASAIARMLPHERDARALGIPIMGSGLVFPVAESTIRIEPFPIPPHWARICGLDFGWAHKSAWVSLAHDRDSDVVYVTDCWGASETPVMTQAGIITARGMNSIPHSWPHDGLQHEKGSGDQLAPQYKKHGINMLAERAQFEPAADGRPGGNSVEAGLAMMMERFQTRRLRVFSHLEEWFVEMRGYHRKDGIVVKEDDDVLCATRYALMMLRKAKTLAEIAPQQAMRRGMFAPMPSFEVFDSTVAY